jgi:hypothetical protein
MELGRLAAGVAHPRHRRRDMVKRQSLDAGLCGKLRRLNAGHHIRLNGEVLLLADVGRHGEQQSRGSR